MATTQILISLFILLVLFPPSTHSLSSVHDILPTYALPRGLLPSSVSNYTLSDNGDFQVTLPSPCYVNFEYLVYYDTLVTGTLKYGSISELKGVKVQRFGVFWFEIDEIKVDLPETEWVYFRVGVIEKRLDAEQFRRVRECESEWVFGDVLKMPPPLHDDVPMLVTE
ncbi:hypothetical protein AKJ16_DCAP17613 [Drosera capensis]